MARAEHTIEINRSANDILDFILDVEAYRVVDPRLNTIQWLRRAPDCTVFRFRPALMGMPAPRSTQMVVRAGNRVDISMLPSISDALVDFHGSLVAEEREGMTRVTRCLTFRFNPLLRSVLDRRLEVWLCDDVRQELVRLKELMESGMSRRIG